MKEFKDFQFCILAKNLGKPYGSYYRLAMPGGLLIDQYHGKPSMINDQRPGSPYRGAS